MTKAEMLDAALETVESDSVREWANSEHNRPILEDVAGNALRDGGDPRRLGAYIVCLAIGA